MDDLLKKVLEAVAGAEQALGLDWRTSFSRANTIGPGSFEVELSREEVLEALPAGLGGIPGVDFDGERRAVAGPGGVSVAIKLLEPVPGSLLWTVSSVADVRREPTHAAELVTQLIMGETAGALAAEGDWFLARLGDGYHGWIRSWYVREAPTAAIRSYEESARFAVAANVAYVRSSPEEGSLPISDVVAGTRIVADRPARGYREVALPGGKRGFMRQGDLIEWTREARESRGPAERALAFLGIPYLWGGTTPKGFDCSGLVKRVFLMKGVALPRDSDQQAAAGEGVPGEGIEEIEADDLLFFGEGGKVSHVALSLGRGRFVHAYGEVRVNSLRESDPDYDEKLARTFLFARRVPWRRP